MHHFVYHTVITKNETGRVLHYIGKHSTENLNDGYVGSGIVIQKILNKEKSNPGTYEIECTRSKFFESSDEAYFFEELAISEARDKFGKKNVINISAGGRAPILRGEEHPMYGRGQTESAKEKLRKANFGKKASEETKAKMRASSKKYLDSVEVHFNSGKKASEETKAKMRASAKRRGMPSNGNIELYSKIDELFEIWIANSMPRRQRFSTIITKLGFPTCTPGVIKHLEEKLNDEQREITQNNKELDAVLYAST